MPPVIDPEQQALLDEQAALNLAEEQRLKAIAKKRRKREREMRAKLFDDEAALGSDNEENDDRVKHIDKDGDSEEDESGLDSDLEGFVEKGAIVGDQEEIQAGNQAALDLYHERLVADDQQAVKDAYNAVINGVNKKRRGLGGGSHSLLDESNMMGGG